MEVAVSKSTAFYSTGLVQRTILSFSLLLLAGGCADTLTYSHDAQLQGMNLYRQGDYADAAGAFRNSVRQDPQNYEAYYWLGKSYEQLKQYQQAIAAYHSARETIGATLNGKYDTETHDNILIGLASAMAKCDQRDIETNAIQRQAESKGTADNWFVLAKVFEDRGDADSAIDAYNRAALLEPNNFLVQKHYGIFLARVGQTQRAEGPLRRAYSLNNQDEEVAAALRKIGVVPGPSLKDKDQLVQPLVPKGPLPDLNLPQTGSSGNAPRQSTVQAPRD
jgi:tetratricopeptide (TPR) repeat protein